MDEKKMDDLLYYSGIGFNIAGIILLCVNLIAKPKGNLCSGTGLVCMALSHLPAVPLRKTLALLLTKAPGCDIPYRKSSGQTGTPW